MNHEDHLSEDQNTDGRAPEFTGLPGLSGLFDGPRTLNRREFVKTLAVATAGTGLFAAAFQGCILSPNQRREVGEALADKVGKLPKRAYGTRMGKMKITPMVICQDWAPELYGPGLDAGINYIHKAGYWRQLPEEFKRIPRDSFIAEACVDSTPRNPDDEDRAYRQVTDALSRTGLRYFDIFRAHFGWQTVADFKEKRGTYRAFQRLKREGKCRYFGCTQHDYRPYPEIIAAEIEDGTIDTIQLFYSYGAPSEVNEILEKAHKAGIAISAMKVYATGADKMRGNPARMAELKAPGQVGRALYRHVLNQKAADGKPLIESAVSAIQNFAQFEENVGGFSPKVAAVDGFRILA